MELKIEIYFSIKLNLIEKTNNAFKLIIYLESILSNYFMNYLINLFLKLKTIIFLEKATEIIWKSAFKGGKEIDTKTVDNSKRIDEFDSETQAALNKIVYEQTRKRNGLPTTEEEKKLEALKEAWNKPGSPFAGQPFDPSMFNLNEPIYMNTPDYEAKLKAKQNKDK